MNLLRNTIVFSLGCFLISAKPAFSAEPPNTKKGACIYSSSALVYMPLSSKTKFYPSRLATYDRGLVFETCSPDNGARYMKIDCISRVLYLLQRDDTYIKFTVLGSSSPGDAMCKKYF